MSGGAAAPAAPEADLFPGDTLRVESGGSARFELRDAGTYELVRGAARFQRGGAVRLAGATVVVSSQEPVEADFEAVQLALDRGTVRVELPSSGRVAAYEVEGLRVTAGGQQVPVPELWQVSVTAEGRLDQARPLQFTRDDPIDAVQLAHALEVDDKLGNLLRGLEPQLAALGPGAVPNRLRAAGIPPEVYTPFLGAARSDLLMGLAFALQWKPAELVPSFQQAVALKMLGASWGLVAQNFKVAADPLVARLQSEITAVLFPQGPGSGDSLVPSPSPADRRGAVASPGRQPAAPAAPAAAPAPAPAPAPGAPAPGPTPSPGLLAPVVDPLRPLLPDELEAIIDEVYGLVHGLVPLL